jgi:PAS domain S-box-containing protein
MLSPTSRTFDPIPLSNSLAAIIIVDHKGNIQECSNGFCEFINMVRTAIIDNSLASLLTKAEQPIVQRLLTEVFSGLPSNASLTFTGTDKKTRIGNVTFTPLLDNNNISGAYCFIKDVGDQPDITRVRTDSEQRLKAIFENEPECVKITSPKGKIIDMNPSGLRMVEAEDKAVVLGADVYQLIDEEDKEIFKSFHQNALRGISGRLEFRITGLKGTKRWMDSNMVPLRNANEEVYAVLSVTRDVTERKKAEFLLANNERRFRSLVEMGSDLIGIVDANGFYKYAGPSALSVLGYTAEDLIEKSAFEFIHPQDARFNACK